MASIAPKQTRIGEGTEVWARPKTNPLSGIVFFEGFGGVAMIRIIDIGFNRGWLSLGNVG
jgi:hypothetical protein